jgi:hypothetical protein
MPTALHAGPFINAVTAQDAYKLVIESAKKKFDAVIQVVVLDGQY